MKYYDCWQIPALRHRLHAPDEDDPAQQHEAFIRCCFNVGPAAKTVNQHWNSIGWMSLVRWGVLARIFYTHTTHLHLSSCLLPADSLISRICAMSSEPPSSLPNSCRPDNLTWVWPPYQSVNRWRDNEYSCCSHPLHFVQASHTPVVKVRLVVWQSDLTGQGDTTIQLSTWCMYTCGICVGLQGGLCVLSVCIWADLSWQTMKPVFLLGTESQNLRWRFLSGGIFK